MSLTKKQREIIVGMILGDGYLQMTGSKNARLRVEHSVKQKEYIEWKYEQLKNMMQSKPRLIKRFNPVWKRNYSYYRLQSHSSPVLGLLKGKFYNKHGERIIPQSFEKMLCSSLTMAVWYMDDGYLYERDKMTYIYIPQYSKDDLLRITEALNSNYKLSPRVLKKKGGNMVLRFTVEDTQKLLEIVRPHIIQSMMYKILPTP